MNLPIRIFLGALLALPLSALAQEEEQHFPGDGHDHPEFNVRPYEPWKKEIVEEFRKLPVVFEGRIRPMNTVAINELYALSTKTSFVREEGGKKFKISADEWLMDMLFRQDFAVTHPVFMVDDSNAVVTFGAVPKHKRDRYSYSDLFPGMKQRGALGETANSIQERMQKKAKLSSLEEQLLVLFKRTAGFEAILGTTRPIAPGAMGGMSLPDFISNLPALQMANIESALQRGPQPENQQVFQTLVQLYSLQKNSTSMMFFPPQDPKNEHWESPGSLMLKALESEAERPWAFEQMRKLEPLLASATDQDKFAVELKKFDDDIRTQAEARGEMKTIPYELKYYKDAFETNPRIVFTLALVLAILGWISPGSKFSKYLNWAAMGTGAIACALLINAMFLRSMARGWAPVTNLYETFLFISAAAFILGMFVEFFTRNKIGLTTGIFTPALLMWLAILFRGTDTSEDTLPPLVAVLRSNFWLSTHVICITLGYCAGIFAALVSHYWIIGQAFGVNTKDKKSYKTITTMTYGIALFSLFLSLVGTVLGGIWANYSWGRFWGWDPKENGALMIVLWTLVILHARLGGYIRDLGLHVLMVLLGCIISFSWFGVNALGVGLHSYGFAAGIMNALYVFWGIEALVLCLAGYLKYREIQERKNKSGGDSGNAENLASSGAA